MTTLITTVTIIASLVQCYFWFIHFAIRIQSPQRVDDGLQPFVSVVVCAHNDGSMLEINLPALLSQTYNKFEVVVVDHGSTDETNQILQGVVEQHRNVRLVFEPYDGPGKRGALQTGIDAAKGPILILTDADCHPFSSQWISHMVAPFRTETDLTLGAAPFTANQNLLNAFSRWENFVTLQLFTSEAIKQRPFMALGRNMAFRKSLATNPTLTDHDLIGGDDDLFVNRIGKTHTTSIVIDSKAHMMSPAKETIKSFLHQKRRHVSTSRRYQRSDQIFLIVFAASTWVQLCGLAIVLLLGYWYISLVLYVIRLIGLIGRIKTISNDQPAYRFGWKLPLVDISYLAYYPFLTLFMLQKPPLTWK